MDITPNTFTVINQNRISFLHTLALYACLIVIILSITTLVGWQVNNPLLKSVIPGQTPTHPIEALGLILLSISLVLFLRLQNKYTTIGSFVLTSISILYSLGAIGGLTSFPSLVPNTFAAFILTGFSILFLLFRKKYFARIGQTFALMSGAISLFAVIGYIYQVLVFYRFSSFPPMALNTALAFSFLAIALLCIKADHGLMRVFVLQTFSSNLAFRIFLSLLTIPPLLGFLILLGQSSGIYDSNMAIAMVVIGNIVIFSILVWINTYSLQQLELEDLIIKEELKNKNIQLELNAKELSKEILHREIEKEEDDEKKAHERMLLHAAEF